MMEMPRDRFTAEFSIDSSGETVVTVNATKNGEGVLRKVTLADFLKMMDVNSEYAEDVLYFTHGIAQEGLISSISDNQGGLGAIFHLKKGKQFFSTKGKNYMLPFPGLVFAIRVNMDGVLKVGLCYAVKDAVITEDTILYRYPYGNVSGDNGKICFGSGNVEKPDGPITYKEIYRYIDLFLSADTSPHYYKPGSTTTIQKEFIDLIEYINELGEFPDASLLPADPFIKVGSLIYLLK